MDKKQIFHAVAGRLNLSIAKEETFPFDNETFITKIEIDNMVTRESLARSPKKFYGHIQRTEIMAIQSAYEACLNFLTEQKFIIIDDYNYHHTQLLGKQLFSSKSWAMLFETEISSLHHAITSKNKRLTYLAGALKQLYPNFSSHVSENRQNLLTNTGACHSPVHESKQHSQRTLERIYNELTLLSKEPDSIIAYPPDYILRFETPRERAIVERHKILNGPTFTLTLERWSSEYRASFRAWFNTKITIDILGIPPHAVSKKKDHWECCKYKLETVFQPYKQS
ncbi:hypothetical protein BS78_04G142000 [Paspalum vaginatum]|nr:hypothetical protein BS78_04G142000 [Paspalum vaginatum]